MCRATTVLAATQTAYDAPRGSPTGRPASSSRRPTAASTTPSRCWPPHRSRRSRSISCAAPSRRVQRPTRRWSAASSTATTSGAATSPPRSAKLEALKALSPERRRRDIDEPVPHAARRRRRARADPRLKTWLAFADQKVAQVATLAAGLRRRQGGDPGTSWMPHPPPWTTAHGAPGVRDGDVRAARGRPRRGRLPPQRLRRPVAAAQDAAFDLPAAADHDHRVVPADRRDPQGSARAFAKGEIDRGRVRGLHASRRSSASSSCRRRSASTCSCTASRSATTWCSTSPRTSTASP